MKGILWYVTRKLEGIFDGILMEFRMRISEDKNQTQKSMYIPRFLSSGLYGSTERSRKKKEKKSLFVPASNERQSLGDSPLLREVGYSFNI